MVVIWRFLWPKRVFCNKNTRGSSLLLMSEFLGRVCSAMVGE